MITKEQLLQLQAQLAHLTKEHEQCLADVNNTAAPGKAAAAQFTLDALTQQVEQIRAYLADRLKPTAEEYRDTIAYANDKDGNPKLTSKEANLDKIYYTKKFITDLNQLGKSILNKHPAGNTGQLLRDALRSDLLTQTITRLTQTRDALRAERTYNYYEISSADVINIDSRIAYLDKQIQLLTQESTQIANPLAIEEGQKLSEAQCELLQHFQDLDLGKHSNKLSAELAHSQLLCAPATAVNSDPQLNFGESQAKAYEAVNSLDPDLGTSEKLEALNAVVEEVGKQTPWDGSTQQDYMEGSKKAANVVNLLATVPAFNRLTDTHPGKKGEAMPSGINAALDELDGILNTVSGLASQADELSNKLRNPSIDPKTKQELLINFGNTYEQLSEMGNTLNSFLYDHATTFNTRLKRYEGGSELSVITQEKLDELVAFNDKLIDTMRSKLSTEAGFDPHRGKGTGTIWDWPASLVKWLWFNKPWDNRNSMTRAGGSNSWRRHLLTSDAGFTDFYGSETRTETYERYGFCRLFTRKAPSELDNCKLPIHGLKLPAHATAEQQQEAQGLSILAAAKQAFGARWQEHVYFKNGGKDVRVTWDNKDQKKAFIDAVKKLDDKYTKLMKKINDPDVTATQTQGPQQSSAHNDRITAKTNAIQTWRRNPPLAIGAAADANVEDENQEQPTAAAPSA